MTNLFMLSYQGGMCGDFFCLEVSKDENFYKNTLISETGHNRWLNANPLSKFNLDLKENITSISDGVKEQIDLEFKDKNLIIPSHYWGSPNLPRLKRIGIFCKDPDYVPLFFIMLFLKALSNKREFGKPGVYSALGRMHEQHGILDRFAHNNLNHPRIQQMYSRGFYYNFELRALELGMINSEDMISQYYKPYHVKALRSRHGFYMFAMDQFLNNPRDYTADLSKYLNMSAELNPAAFEEYQQKNFMLIERTFNRSYHNLIKENWLGALKDHIDQICPQHWFIRTNQQP